MKSRGLRGGSQSNLSSVTSEGCPQLAVKRLKSANRARSRCPCWRTRNSLHVLRRSSAALLRYHTYIFFTSTFALKRQQREIRILIYGSFVHVHAADKITARAAFVTKHSARRPVAPQRSPWVQPSSQHAAGTETKPMLLLAVFLPLL